jgi:hypothetical protein
MDSSGNHAPVVWIAKTHTRRWQQEGTYICAQCPYIAAKGRVYVYHLSKTKNPYA